MNAVVKSDQFQLPAPVARRGINEAQWRTLINNLFPGAKSESVIMVWDYCVARKLDPMKKPCHIVPMQVKDSSSGDYVWRDVVMPGIYEYRTTASRTRLYLGHAKPVYGERVEYMGVLAPEYCEFIVYKWNPEAKMRAEFPVGVRFSEVVGTRKDKKTGEIVVNDRWSRAPQQMLTKCAEAAALREAFPDELGGTHTAEEMDGQTQEVEVVSLRNDPRGDLSNVDWEMRDKHVSSIVDILNADKEEQEISRMLNDYVATHLQPFQELYISVCDKLATDKIISKTNFKKYLSMAVKES